MHKKEYKSRLYTIPLKTIDGEEITLETYAGRVLLIVNVASRCGFTGQYEGLQKLYEKYQEQGLVVLGFPCNDFLWQEPKDEGQIKAFCTMHYGVSFPMFAKLHVRGKEQHPLYRYLCLKETNPQHAHKISWNFNKFLIGKDGEVKAYFGSMTKPLSNEMIKAIEQELKREE